MSVENVEVVKRIVKFRRGKIVSFRDFPSHAEGLEAAGLPE